MASGFGAGEMTRAVGPRVLAWITATTATALLLFGLVIASDARGGLALVGDNSVATMLFGVALAVVGAIIIDRKGSHLVGWLFCVASVAWALYAVGSGYAQLLLADPSHESAVADGFVWIASWANLIGFACIPGYLLFVFPTGRLWDPRWSRGVAAVTVATASGVIGYAFAPGPMEDFPWLRNPYGIHGVAGTVAEALTGLSWP